MKFGGTKALGKFVIALLFALRASTSDAQNVRVLQASAGADKPIGKYLPAFHSPLVLNGSRNETLLFLMRIEGTGCVPLRLEFAPGKKIPFEITFYELPWISTVHPSYPGAPVGRYLDPVVPSRTFCIHEKQKNWVLGEVAIPSDAEPGDYDGTLIADLQRLPVKMTVWHMRIPERPILPAYSELSVWYAVLAHYGKWTNDQAPLARAYIGEMEQHRIYPLRTHIGPFDLVTEGNSERLEIDKKPSPETSFRAITLENRPIWAYFDFPAAVLSGGEPIEDGVAARYFRALEKTIADIGRKDRALIYLWDEPKPDDFEKLLRRSRFVKANAPSLKQLVTAVDTPALRETVDIFAPVINQFDQHGYPPPAAYRELQKQGHEVWWYVSCMSHGCKAPANPGTPDLVVDRPSSYVRAIGWLSMKYGIDAFLYYAVNNGYKYYPKRDSWDSLWNFSGNGDGTLFYPGRPGEHGLAAHLPITSLRLKLWRESSYDAEYIHWMNTLDVVPDWWVREFSATTGTPTTWSHNYDRYAALRSRAGNYLDNLLKNEQ